MRFENSQLYSEENDFLEVEIKLDRHKRANKKI